MLGNKTSLKHAGAGGFVALVSFAALGPKLRVGKSMQTCLDYADL
jgi:hypothetical protein